MVTSQHIYLGLGETGSEPNVPPDINVDFSEVRMSPEVLLVLGMYMLVLGMYLLVFGMYLLVLGMYLPVLGMYTF
jgi:hypothetical protein